MNAWRCRSGVVATWVAILAVPEVAHASDPRLVPAEPDAAAAEQEPARSGPWRAAEAAGSPPWLSFSAAHRTRYEHLWNQFRAGAPGDDTALALRTNALVELHPDPMVVGAELLDSRMYLSDGNAPLDTTHVNPLELLQAYVGADLENLFVPGATGRIRAGRYTMDVGSRRLVARNRFRNTINAFTGIDLQWTGPGGDHLHGFATFPIQRLPDDAEDLADNTIEFDRDATNALFWGIFLGTRAWLEPIRLELYLFGLSERDSDAQPTKNRNLLTPGLRVFHEPEPGDLDFETEMAFQTGSSRASSRDEDTTDLDHLAYFGHVSVGYTFDVAWQPRLILTYDHASGDRDLDDGVNDRFDTLYGARRWEYGPTGIYGALARSNLRSPEVRVQVVPHSTLDATAAYRPVWLAQERDAWTASGLRDATGASGTFVGNQVEARIRWRILPGNILMDTGFAHLWLGEFPTRAPNANPGSADPTYAYVQAVLEM